MSHYQDIPLYLSVLVVAVVSPLYFPMVFYIVVDVAAPSSVSFSGSLYCSPCSYQYFYVLFKTIPFFSSGHFICCAKPSVNLGNCCNKSTFSYFVVYTYLHQVLSQWIVDQPPLGHKAPIQGEGGRRERLEWCPACRGLLQTPTLMSSRHAPLQFYFFPGILFIHPIQACFGGLYGSGGLQSERGNQELFVRLQAGWMEPGYVVPVLCLWTWQGWGKDCQGRPPPPWC